MPLWYIRRVLIVYFIIKCVSAINYNSTFVFIFFEVGGGVIISSKCKVNNY